MRSTLFINEGHYGTSKKVADILALVLGYGKNVDISDAPEDISKYDNLVLIFSFYGNHTAEKIKTYLSAKTEILKSKRIGIVGVGLCEIDIDNYVLYLKNVIGKELDAVGFVQGEVNEDKITENDKKILNVFFENNKTELIKNKGFDEKKVFEIADRFSEILNKPLKELTRQELFKEINKFIINNNTCALATGRGDYVRNTPIEYTFYKNNFYFISEGGFKFRGILQNSNVSIAIFNKYTSMNELKGMQVTGKSEIIPCWNEEYIQVINYKGLNINTLINLLVDLNLIKVVPQVFEFLNTDFKKKGMDSKQYYYVNSKTK